MKIKFSLNKGFYFAKEQAPQQAPNGKKRIYHQIVKQRTYRTDLEMSKLGEAIDAARDTQRPSRLDLYSIYDQIRRDRHLKSQVETSNNEIQQSRFDVIVDGKENKELKELFDAEWFDDFVEYACDAEYWGHSLIEFPEVNEQSVFDGCFLIPRESVEPSLQRIVIDRDRSLYLPYSEKLQELNLIEIEGKEELGIFEYAAEEIILKKYARSDWSQSSEKYGMPYVDYATDVTDKGELDKIEDMCQNFAANGYIIRGKDDVVEIKQADKGDFYKIYLEAIQFSNSELSKLLNGQTATSESQAFVGTAEVHERVKNVFRNARLRRVQNHINGKLIPLMVKNGYQKAELLAKAKVRYRDLVEKDPIPEESKTPPTEPAKPADPTKPQAGLKKKLKPVAASKIDVKLDAWLERFFNGIDGIDKDVWKLNFESLLSAAENAGISFETGYNYEKLANELRSNAAAFAAFKNHDEQTALRELLVDENGKPRSLSEFKKAAKPLTEKYNKEWLQTEFKQAEASAQMAVKWAGFEENADLYPNLRYDAVLDDQTRPEHARMDGLVLPIDHPFWNKNYPPNDWGCRCDVTQTDEEVSKKIPGFDPADGFGFNPGKDKMLFSEDTSYFTNADESVAKAINSQTDAFLREYLNDD